MLLLVESRYDDVVQYLVKAEKLADLVRRYKLFNESLIIREVPVYLVAFLMREWVDDTWREVLNIGSLLKDGVTPK